MGVVSNYVMNNSLLEEVTEIKDQNVCINSLLVFDKHICEKNKHSCLHDVRYNYKKFCSHLEKVLCNSINR